MKAHQKIVRDNAAPHSGLFPLPDNPSLSTAELRRISYLTAQPIIEEHEWIGTMPLPKSCRFIYGVYFDGVIGGVIVYVEPSTRQFNANYPRQVVQLNRGACIYWTPKNTASWMIGRSFRDLRKHGVLAILAYCTPEAGEYGTIYQACNFDYVGQTTKSRSYFLDNHWISERTLADKKAWAKTKHAKWVTAFESLPSREQLPKFRYLKFIGTHGEKKKFLSVYQFRTLPFPKRAPEVSSGETPVIQTGNDRFNPCMAL